MPLAGLDGSTPAKARSTALVLRRGLNTVADAPHLELHRGEPSPAADPEPLWTAERVARYLGVRPKRVYELGIPSVRLAARTLRWRRGDVEAWLEARTRVA